MSLTIGDIRKSLQRRLKEINKARIEDINSERKLSIDEKEAMVTVIIF